MAELFEVSFALPERDGFNYNYFRDYDSATGKYVESDPVGLNAGVNTYVYGRANPLTYIDEDGLNAVALPFPGPAAVASASSAVTAVAVAGAGVAGYGIGTMLYPRIEPAVTRIVQMCSGEDAREQCRQKCDEAYSTQIKVCKMFPSKSGRRQCYENAANLYGECLRNCR